MYFGRLDGGVYRRIHHRMTAWLAMLVMALAVCAPSLAQAVISLSGSGDWVEICQVSGTVRIKLDAGGLAGKSSDGGSAGAAMKCPWCSVHGSAPGLPSSVRTCPLPSSTLERVAPIAQPRIVDAFWRGTPARGPPISG